MGIKGYKVFDHNWSCGGFQYKVGETYKYEGNIELCNKGFHFCRKVSDCFNYYDFNPKNKIAEVEAIGLVESDNKKSVTDEIRIIKEITWNEMLEIANSGKGCTGMCNSGNWNSGNWNSGDWNSGNRNSGNSNSGNCNSGNWNSGDWNSGDWNSGYFNSDTTPIYMFSKIVNASREEIINNKGVKILNWRYENGWWIYSQNMTAEEKREHPEHETTGGYLKTIEFKKACRLMWNNFDEEEKRAVLEIPNFDADIFKEITGIEVRK